MLKIKMRKGQKVFIGDDVAIECYSPFAHLHIDAPHSTEIRRDYSYASTEDEKALEKANRLSPEIQRRAIK